MSDIADRLRNNPPFDRYWDEPPPTMETHTPEEAAEYYSRRHQLIVEMVNRIEILESVVADIADSIDIKQS